jgi:hypothetical protein
MMMNPSFVIVFSFCISYKQQGARGLSLGTPLCCKFKNHDIEEIEEISHFGVEAHLNV